MSVFGDLFGAQTSLTPDWRIQEVIGSIFIQYLDDSDVQILSFGEL